MSAKRQVIPDDERAERRIKRVYTVTSVLYFLLGVLLCARAWGQTRVAAGGFFTSPITPVPTGNDDRTVMQYYDYLYLRQLRQFQETYFANAHYLSWVYGGIAVVLILFYFLVWAWYSRKPRHDLYPVEVYNGYISERGGPVDPFSWAAWAILFSYMAYYAVINLIWGQNY